LNLTNLKQLKSLLEEIMLRSGSVRSIVIYLDFVIGWLCRVELMKASRRRKFFSQLLDTSVLKLS